MNLLTFGICTYGVPTERVIFSSPPQNIIVSHQDYQGKKLRLDFVDNSDTKAEVTYLKLNGLGLSKNRNNVIRNCQTKYLYVLDDDVYVDHDKAQELVAYMERNQIDIATSRFVSNDCFVKKYSVISFPHGYISSLRVSSIEMCINVEACRRNSVYFNEDMGLGAKYPSGEEYDFLVRSIRSGIKAVYVPITICQHNDVTSGADFFSSADKVWAKAKMMECLPVAVRFFLKLIFFVRKLPILYSKRKTIFFLKHYYFTWIRENKS